MGFTYDTGGQAVAMAERPAAPVQTEQSALAGLAVTQEMKVIGRSSKAAAIVTKTETRIAVAAKKLVDNLFSRRESVRSGGAGSLAKRLQDRAEDRAGFGRA